MKNIIFIYSILLFSCSVISQSNSIANNAHSDISVTICGRESHTLFLSNGLLFSVGRNDAGQLEN